MTPDLTCELCRELLPLYVAGQLPPAERATVDAHLSHCAACRLAAAQWSAIGAALTDGDTHIPADSTTDADSTWAAISARLPRQAAQASTRERIAVLTDTDGSSEIAPAQRTRTRAPGRGRLALPAAIILIALSVGLFGLLGPQLRRHTTPAAATATPTPTSCSASDLRASLPPQSDVQDISMTSPRDGWAVGSVGAPINATAPHSLILRFQNCQWQSFGDSIPATELDSVSMTSPTDGWAVGLALKDFTNTTSGVTSHQWNGDQLITLHYQNGQWQRVTIAGDMAAIHAKVRMTPAGDGWMLIDGGKYHINPYYPNSAVTLLHYENGQWIPIPLTFDASKTVMLWDIAATESDDCWVVGYGFAPNDTFAIGHYHQGVWTTYSGGQLGLRYPVLYTVAMSGPNDIWVAGSYSYKDANGDHSGPLVFHFDGSTWTRQQVGVASDPMADLTIMSLAVASPGEVWGHNWGDGGGQIYSVHLKDGVWTWTAEPHMAASIGATTFVSSSEGFAVEGIYALDGNGQQAYTSEMLHYANGTWSVIPSR